MKQNNSGRYILGTIKYLLTATLAHYNTNLFIQFIIYWTKYVWR